MGSRVYVASVEGYTGKSTVALGILEQLSRRVERVGVFRPIVRAGLRSDVSGRDSGRDYVLDLLTSHDAVTLSYDECAGVSYDAVHEDPSQALDRIVERYHEVAEKCDAVVIVGSDYTNVGTPTEFSFNARIAANLGAPVVLVLNGAQRSPAELHTITDLAVTELKANHGTLFAVIANRLEVAALQVALDALGGGGVLASAIPDEPLLSAPTVGDLRTACQGVLVSGEESLLGREVTGLVVAAMTMPNVLDRLFDGAVVVTPGDRPEVVLGVLTAHASVNVPQISGIVLNGGFPLPAQVSRLIDGLGVTMPIVANDRGTADTAARLSPVRGRLHAGSPRKIATALALFAEHVDGEALLDRLELARSQAVTPLMFEHQLLDLSLADRRHIVLPEGDDDRVLRAAEILLRRKVADLTVLGDPRQVERRA